MFLAASISVVSQWKSHYSAIKDGINQGLSFFCIFKALRDWSLITGGGGGGGGYKTGGWVGM